MVSSNRALQNKSHSSQRKMCLELLLAGFNAK